MTDDKVIPIRKKTDQESFKKSINTLAEAIVGKHTFYSPINGALWWREYGPDYRVYSPDGIHTEIVAVDDKKIATRTSVDSFINPCYEFIHEVSKTLPIYARYGLREVQTTFDSLAMVQKIIDIPMMVPFDDDRITFHRMPFPIPERDYMWAKVYEDLKAGSKNYIQILSSQERIDAGTGWHFFDFLVRMKNNIIPFLAFTWSIFEFESARNQYLYLYGTGRDGKSSYLNMLNYALGPLYYPGDTARMYEKFWAGEFIGKRLVGFDDAGCPSLPTKPKFKALCGMNCISVEKKGKDATKEDINAKFILAANDRISIDKTSIADLRRVIYVEVDTLSRPPISDEKWNNICKKETPEFLSFCRYVYRQECRETTVINADHDLLMNTSSSIDYYEYVANTYFDFPNDYEREEEEKITPKVLRKFKISKEDLQRKLINFGGHFLSNQNRGKFLKYLESAKKIYDYKNVQDRKNYYLGIREKQCIVDTTLGGAKITD